MQNSNDNNANINNINGVQIDSSIFDLQSTNCVTNLNSDMDSSITLKIDPRQNTISDKTFQTFINEVTNQKSKVRCPTVSPIIISQDQMKFIEHFQSNDRCVDMKIFNHIILFILLIILIYLLAQQY